MLADGFVACIFLIFLTVYNFTNFHPKYLKFYEEYFIFYHHFVKELFL